ncbi:uncharacterized protein LOC119190725 [Manduca sexta]|uniref:uncharacterized protein LOC119190725 n=1 Tax=Manduca sexta TaxID=7130 RepID=UPI00188FDCAB|nr:uncharacterized protein LOC119190725 [Manduca sexta]
MDINPVIRVYYVIDEVLHRRDWERSTKDLYIPLNPVRNSDGTDSPEKAPHAEPESSSIECLKSDEVKPCKKHHTNIKSSKKKAEGNKEKATSDDKDCDVTEQTFYIGDTIEDSNFDNTELEIRNDNNLKVEEKPAKVCKAKEAKQSLNESIRSKERPKPALMPLAEHQHAFTFSLDEVIERLDTLEPLDRSGAYHHGIESRISGTRSTYPPPSVEAVGYDGCACYLSGEERAPAGSEGGAGGAGALGSARGARGMRVTGTYWPRRVVLNLALSLSDLDLDLEGGGAATPYDELHQYASPQKKETAI